MRPSHRRRTPARASVLLLGLAIAACQAAPSPPRTTAPTPEQPVETAMATALVTGTPGATATATAGPTLIASPTPQPTRIPNRVPSPALSCVQQTYARLTPDQRIGQLFAMSIAGSALQPAEASAIETDHLGSVWLANNRTAGTAAIRVLTNSIQALAPGATGGVGFFVAADQEGGYVQRLTGPGFSAIPTALAQGSLPAAVLQADARAWGSQLATAGVNLDFAPVMDVVPPGGDATNAPIGQLQREYGHDPATAGAHGAAVVMGMSQAGVATTLKHFPGLGRVIGNTDFTGGVVDTVTTMTDSYLGSFASGIRAHAPFVMVSLATYTQIDPNHLAVFSPIVITTLLRGRLGFAGVVASDSLGGTAAVAAIDPGERAIAFISAGGDLVLVDTPARAEAMFAAVKQLAGANATFRAQVNAAALLILETKAAYGLVSCG